MRLAPRSDEGLEWAESRKCEICHKPIPAERLELYPNATRCAACESCSEESHGAAEYCRICGGIMVIKMARGSGISRYKMVCRDCGGS